MCVHAQCKNPSTYGCAITLYSSTAKRACSPGSHARPRHRTGGVSHYLRRTAIESHINLLKFTAEINVLKELADPRGIYEKHSMQDGFYEFAKTSSLGRGCFGCSSLPCALQCSLLLILLSQNWISRPCLYCLGLLDHF